MAPHFVRCPPGPARAPSWPLRRVSTLGRPGGTDMANILLKVSGLKVAYGGIQAVKGISFEVREGELVSLIGANGAGKTTTLKAVTGLQPVAAGEIEYLGRNIRGRGAWDLVKEGLVM